MKTVLVPCDFSQQSRAAYKTALEIVSRTSGKVILLHVLYIPTQYTSSVGSEAVTFDPVYFTTMEEDARRELEKMQDDAKAYSVNVKIEVVFGEIISSIKEWLKPTKLTYEPPGTNVDDFRNQQPPEPNEVPVPHKDPTTVPGKEPGPDVWPHKDPEITPGEEPLTKPAAAPPEMPKPPEY